MVNTTLPITTTINYSLTNCNMHSTSATSRRMKRKFVSATFTTVDCSLNLLLSVKWHWYHRAVVVNLKQTDVLWDIHEISGARKSLSLRYILWKFTPFRGLITWSYTYVIFRENFASDVMMMKLPILPCAEKLELVLCTAPKTWDNTEDVTQDWLKVAANSADSLENASDVARDVVLLLSYTFGRRSLW